MPEDAEELLRRELADIQAERPVLDARVEAHEQDVAEKEQRQADFDVRLRAAKAKRELERMKQKQAQEDDILTKRHERQKKHHAEEIAARRAAKEAERQREEEEIEKELAEGEEILARKHADEQRERERKWREQETKGKDLAKEADELHQLSQRRAQLMFDDHQALAVLFRALDVNKSGFIEADELQQMIRAVVDHGPRSQLAGSTSLQYQSVNSRTFKRFLSEFNASVNGRITISGLRSWWDNNGVWGKGLAAKLLMGSRSQNTGVGTAPRLVAGIMGCLQRLGEVQAVTSVQAAVRRFLQQKVYLLEKTSGLLPGSQRVAAKKIQSHYRMRLAKSQYAMLRQSSNMISAAIRRRQAMKTYKVQQEKKEKQGYSFAARTVHVSGIGKEWEDEKKLTAWFARGGEVFSAVVRKRKPEPGFPNNSWGLVAFRHEETLRRLLSLAGREPTGADTDMQEGKVFLKADAADKAEDAVVFGVTRIHPGKAMGSTGSFGATFKLCVDKAERIQKQLNREAKARVKREQARQDRCRELATPIPVRVQTKEQERRAEQAALEVADTALRSLHAKLDTKGPQHDQKSVHGAAAEVLTQCEEVVMAKFSDGWIQCCQWPPAGATVHNPSPTLAEMEQQGRPYYFNVRSGESRWLPPPSLAGLSKTSAKVRPIRVAGAIPRTPRASGSVARHIYAQVPKRPKQWHPSGNTPRADSVHVQHRATTVDTGRISGQPHHLPIAWASQGRNDSRGGPNYNSKQRRVVPQRQLLATMKQMSHPDDAECREDIDPVTYMMQWQHQKYLSGPKTRDFDCFAPKQAQGQNMTIGQWRPMKSTGRITHTSARLIDDVIG